MFLIILALIVGAWSEEPFWRSKDKVYDRIRDREVIVSVKTEELKGATFRNSLTVSGGGQMRTPCEFAFTSAQNFEQVAGESGYVEWSHYDPATQIFQVKMAAYGFKESCEMKIGPGEDGPHKALLFTITEGRLKNYRGRFVFYPVEGKPGLCDIGTAGEYAYDKLPLPRMFVTFGLEVMFQRMAGRLRAFTEEQFKKTKGVQNDEHRTGF